MIIPNDRDPETSPPSVIDEEQVCQEARPGYLKRAKTFAQLAIMSFEIGPFNEVAQYSLFGTTLASTGSPLAAAAVYGASTLAVEGSVALATAPVLDSDRAGRFIDRVTEKLSNSKIDPHRIHPVVEAGVAVYGGTSLSMALRKIKHSDSTKEENRSFGLKVSGALSAVCIGEGILLAEGIANPSPTTIGAAAVAIGGILTTAKWAKNRLGSNDDKEIQND